MKTTKRKKYWTEIPQEQVDEFMNKKIDYQSLCAAALIARMPVSKQAIAIRRYEGQTGKKLKI